MKAPWCRVVLSSVCAVFALGVGASLAPASDTPATPPGSHHDVLSVQVQRLSSDAMRQRKALAVPQLARPGTKVTADPDGAFTVTTSVGVSTDATQPAQDGPTSEPTAPEPETAVNGIPSWVTVNKDGFTAHPNRPGTPGEVQLLQVGTCSSATPPPDGTPGPYDCGVATTARSFLSFDVGWFAAEGFPTPTIFNDAMIGTYQMEAAACNDLAVSLHASKVAHTFHLWPGPRYDGTPIASRSSLGGCDSQHGPEALGFSGNGIGRAIQAATDARAEKVHFALISTAEGNSAGFRRFSARETQLVYRFAFPPKQPTDVALGYGDVCNNIHYLSSPNPVMEARTSDWTYSRGSTLTYTIYDAKGKIVERRTSPVLSSQVHHRVTFTTTLQDRTRYRMEVVARTVQRDDGSWLTAPGPATQFSAVTRFTVPSGAPQVSYRAETPSTPAALIFTAIPGDEIDRYAYVFNQFTFTYPRPGCGESKALSADDRGEPRGGMIAAQGNAAVLVIPRGGPAGTLAPGHNTVSVQGVDLSGNITKTTTLTFEHLPLTPRPSATPG